MLEIFLGTSLLIVALSFLLLAWSIKQGVGQLLPPRQAIEEDHQPWIVIPDGIKAIIAQESEDWAKSDLEIDIRAMYQKMDKDWDRVYAYLREKVGEPSGEEATNRAWSLQPEAAQEDSNIAGGF